MITRLSASLHLKGDDFSPGLLASTLSVEFCQQNEKGDLAKHGKYKIEGYPFGWAQLKAPSCIDQFKAIQHLADFVIAHRAILDNHGVTERYLYVGYFYEDQCNFEFSESEVEAIASAGLSFGISCYDVSEE